MNRTTKILKAVLALAGVASASLSIAGCLGCGVGPTPGYEKMNQNGAVQFDATTVGSSETLSIPIKDTANVDETITASKITGDGSGSFEILSQLPIFVPAGQSVDVEVRFTPSAAGTTSATLVLQTEGMGPSPIDLEGTGA